MGQRLVPRDRAARLRRPGHSTAFFPLYPLLVRGLGWFLLGHYLLAGVLVSLVASAVAFVLLWKLARELLGRGRRNRSSSLYLRVFPTTLFLFAVYSESLYLLSSVAAFLLAVRGRWGRAGVATGLAALTRVSGVMLLPALAVIAWRVAEPRARAARLAVAVPIMALWPLYLGLVSPPVRVPHRAARGLGAGTCRRPGRSAAPGTRSSHGWRGIRQLVAGSGHDYFPSADHGAMYGAGLNLEQLAYAVLLIASASTPGGGSAPRTGSSSSGASRCRSPTRCRARRCCRCRGSRSASSRSSSRSGRSARGRGCTRRS